MAVSYSYNAKTGVRYAYETTYEFDEAKGRKVQRRKCIGHFDEETGEIVPNGRRGRPRAEAETTDTRQVESVRAGAPLNADEILGRCEELARSLDAIAAEAQRLAAELRSFEASQKGRLF